MGEPIAGSAGMIASAYAWLGAHGVLVALCWMLLANAFALGPDKLKVAALIAMLITAPLIVVAVIQNTGWLVGFPIAVLMCIQMRWAFYFIRRLFVGDRDAG